MLYDRRNLFIKYEKKRDYNMEVVYNVKYKFKNNDNKTNKELKELVNKKLLNIILKLESQELRLNNS